MVLLEIFNKIVGTTEGPFLVCKKHEEVIKENYNSDMFHIRHLLPKADGECQICQGYNRLLNFETIPESFNIIVTFADGRDETGWSASGRIGFLNYVEDHEGNIYTTQEALHKRGVRDMYIEPNFRLYIEG